MLEDSGERERRKGLRLSKLAGLLMRLDHVASFIANAHSIDHDVVAETLRSFAEQQKWSESSFGKDDPRVPAALRVLKPSAIFIHSDFIALDFGGAFFQMDIRAFKPGNPGTGTKKLAEGLWLYTEDGGYPRQE